MEQTLDRLTRTVSQSDQRGRDPLPRSPSVHSQRSASQIPQTTTTKSGGSAYKAVSSDRQVLDQSTSKSKPTMQKLIQRPPTEILGGKSQLTFDQRGKGQAAHPMEVQGHTRESQKSLALVNRELEEDDNPDTMTTEEIAFYDAQMRECTGAPRMGVIGGARARAQPGDE